MATKAKEAQQEAATEPLVHHMIRTIAERPISDATGYVTAEQADAHVSAWVEKGYQLAHVNAQPRKFGEHDIEAWVILYVLVKSQ